MGLLVSKHQETGKEDTIRSNQDFDWGKCSTKSQCRDNVFFDSPVPADQKIDDNVSLDEVFCDIAK